jgi:DNA (cytosine-5)-methyltransferase 1
MTTLTLGSMFSGIGAIEQGIIEGFKHQGIHIKTLWQVEQDKACHPILRRHFPEAQLLEDVNDEKTENHIKQHPTEIVCFGFPCQDISVAGAGAGIHGKRSGLFFRAWELAMLARAQYIFMENVPAITSRGLREICGTISESGYRVEWTTLSAASCGAPHRRNRWWGVAYPDRH